MRPDPERAALYRLLGGLLLGEPDAALAERLREWPAFAEVLPEAGDLVADLRAEYARLFLLNVYPYESVFVDESGMLGAAPSVAVEAEYAAAGFEVTGVPRPGAPDHLGAELWFAARLVETAGREAQRTFLEGHLAASVAPFAEAAARDARHPFYRVLAEVTARVVLEDLADLRAGRLPLATDEPGPAAPAPAGDLQSVSRHLATPCLAGFLLSREALHRQAGRLGLPLALLERPRMVEMLLEGAGRFGVLPVLLDELAAGARAAASRYAGWAADHPAAAAAVRPWERRATRTAEALAGMRREAVALGVG